MPFDRLTQIRGLHVAYLRDKAKTATDVYQPVELNLHSELVAAVTTTVSDWTVPELRESVARHECEHIQKTAREGLKDEGSRWFRNFCAGQLPFEMGGRLMVPDAFIAAPGGGYLSLHLIGAHVFDHYQNKLEKAQQDCADLLKMVRPLARTVRDFLKPGMTFDAVATDVYRQVKYGRHS